MIVEKILTLSIMALSLPSAIEFITTNKLHYFSFQFSILNQYKTNQIFFKVMSHKTSFKISEL